ncbi:MAG: hypothetical protein ABI685_00915 [Ferruginibacter sp.]
MKRNLLLMSAFAMLFFIMSCSKSDTNPPSGNSAAIQGKWSGVFTPPLGPSPYFAITFYNDGTVLVEQNDISTPDIAHGTYAMSGNNITASYTFTGGTTGTYSLAGTYNSTSTPKQITGSIGTGTNTSGYGTFNVSK